jgi:alkylation response protein AidB-like acyl-CoA dehydrogenase
MSYTEKYRWLEPKRKYNSKLFTEEEIQMIEVMRDFAQEKIRPRQWELEGGFNRDIESAWKVRDDLWEEAVSLGLQQLNVPQAYGGLGVSLLCWMAIGAELTRADAAFAAYSGKCAWATGAIFASANEVIKKDVAAKLTSTDCWTSTVAFTEPGGGVNIEDITQEGKSSIVKFKEDGDEWVINGQKVFPGPAGPPEVFQRPKLKGHLGYLLVATEGDADKRGWNGINLFWVPSDCKGLSFSNPYEKHGHVIDRNCDIFFDDVRIPKENRIAGADLGAKIFFGYILSSSRLSLAARITGAAETLLEMCLDYTTHREIEGKPVREHSYFAGILGEMAARINGSRAFWMDVASRRDRPDIYGNVWEQNNLHGLNSAARLIAGQTFDYCAAKAMGLFGGYGYCCETHLEKFIRDIKLFIIGPGGPDRDALDSSLMYYPWQWTGKVED